MKTALTSSYPATATWPVPGRLRRAALEMAALLAIASREMSFLEHLDDARMERDPERATLSLSGMLRVARDQDGLARIPRRRRTQLPDEEVERLREAIRSVLTSWRDVLVAEALAAFPSKVTAFREGMAVHGRYGQPCPVCGAPVQRIVYAENETNYCARCQTGGRILADRALSRLLKKSWPRSIDELG